MGYEEEEEEEVQEIRRGELLVKVSSLLVHFEVRASSTERSELPASRILFESLPGCMSIGPSTFEVYITREETRLENDGSGEIRIGKSSEDRMMRRREGGK